MDSFAASNLSAGSASQQKVASQAPQSNIPDLRYNTNSLAISNMSADSVRQANYGLHALKFRLE